MKLPRRPLKRVVALTTAVVVVGGAAAIADTSSVDVTLGVVNGARALTVTGVGSTGLPAGAPQLSFGSTGTDAPFGLMVTDIAYKRTGYSVTATLSDLRRLATDGTVDCAVGSEVPSSALTVGFATRPNVTDVTALAEPLLTYSDDINDNLTTDLGLDLTALNITTTLTATIADFAGFVQDLDASGLTLMAVSDGAGGTFSTAADHPGCAATGAVGTPIALQAGSTTNPVDLTGLTTTLYNTIESDTDSNTVVDVADTIAAGVLPQTADDAGTITTSGGILWEATRNVLKQLLADNGLTITDADLVTLTTSVVADLEVPALVDGVGDLVLDLVGQSGIYPNLPTLTLDRTKTESAATGMYHGVMTVTLVDAS